LTILKIITEPDSRLHEVSEPVEEITPEIQQLALDMLETMHKGTRETGPGVGLAAPQVGVLKHIIVADWGEGDMVMINPVITAGSGKEAVADESCLSIPSLTIPVSRFEKITVKFLDRMGIEQTIAAEGMPAVVVQHEAEHLEGKTLLSRLNRKQRRQWAKRTRNMR